MKAHLISVFRSEKYASLALRNTAFVLKPGQKIVIVDVVMPVSNSRNQAYLSAWILTDTILKDPQSESTTAERTLRSSDMEMMVQFNALEREVSDWENLIKRADPRLRIQNIHKPPRSANSVIEITCFTSERAVQASALPY